MDTKQIRKFIVGGAIIAVTLVIIALLHIGKPKATAKDVPVKRYGVSVQKAMPETLHPNITLYGKIESPNNADIVATITANVLDTNYLAGEMVKANETIITLDESETKLNYDKALATVANLKAMIANEIQQYNTNKNNLAAEEELLNILKRNVDREKDLIKRKLGTQAKLDEALSTYQRQVVSVNTLTLAVTSHDNVISELKANLQSAIADYELAKLSLTRTKILMPYDGKIEKLFIAKGSRVQPNQIVAKVYDSELLEARTQIPPKYISTIRQALNNNVNIFAKTVIDSEIVTFNLNRLASIIDASQAGIDAVFRAKNNLDLLTLGKTITLDITLPAIENVYKVPATSIYGLDAIYIVENDMLKKVEIERVGRYKSDNEKYYYLIKSDTLKPNDLIITNQLTNAISNLPVTILR